MKNLTPLFTAALLLSTPLLAIEAQSSHTVTSGLATNETFDGDSAKAVYEALDVVEGPFGGPSNLMNPTRMKDVGGLQCFKTTDIMQGDRYYSCSLDNLNGNFKEIYNALSLPEKTTALKRPVVQHEKEAGNFYCLKKEDPRKDEPSYGCGVKSSGPPGMSTR